LPPSWLALQVTLPKEHGSAVSQYEA
jgi:hypothetical protein